MRTVVVVLSVMRASPEVIRKTVLGIQSVVSGVQIILSMNDRSGSKFGDAQRRSRQRARTYGCVLLPSNRIKRSIVLVSEPASSGRRWVRSNLPARL